MKKAICLSLCLAGFIMLANAQLAGTKWKATLQFDSPTEVLLEFGKDTLNAFTVADHGSIEKMVYTFKEGVLTMQKIEGTSDCDPGIVAKFKIDLKEASFRMSLIDDGCEGRARILDGSTWDAFKQ